MLTIDFFSGDFHVDLIGEIFDIEGVLIESKVFGSRCHEGLLVSDDLAIKGVNNGIGLFEESVDSADLL